MVLDFFRENAWVFAVTAVLSYPVLKVFLYLGIRARASLDGTHLLEAFPRVSFVLAPTVLIACGIALVLAAKVTWFRCKALAPGRLSCLKGATTVLGGKTVGTKTIGPIDAFVTKQDWRYTRLITRSGKRLTDVLFARVGAIEIEIWQGSAHETEVVDLEARLSAFLKTAAKGQEESFPVEGSGNSQLLGGVVLFVIATGLGLLRRRLGKTQAGRAQA